MIWSPSKAIVMGISTCLPAYLPHPSLFDCTAATFSLWNTILLMPYPHSRNLTNFLLCSSKKKLHNCRFAFEGLYNQTASFPTMAHTVFPFTMLRLLAAVPWWLSNKESTCHCKRWKFQSLGREDPLENKTSTRSSILAWIIPWMEEPGGLQSMGLQEYDTTWWLNRHHMLRPNRII